MENKFVNNDSAFGVVNGEYNTNNFYYLGKNSKNKNDTKSNLFSSEADIVGRLKEIKKLKEIVLSDKNIETPIIVTGFGGQGKTTLVKYVINSIINDESTSFVAVLYADMATQNSNPVTILNGWAELWGIKGIMNIANVDIKANVLRNKIHDIIGKNHRIIIFVDDLRHNLLESHLEDTQILFKVAGINTSKIITTRNIQVAASFKSAKILPLDSLITNDAIHLSKRLCPNDVDNDKHRRLVKELGRHPLAITLASSIANIYSLDYCLEKLTNNSNRISFLNIPYSNFKNDNLVRSFDITFNHLSEASIKVLGCLSYMKAENILLSLINSLIHEIKTEKEIDTSEILEELIRFNILAQRGGYLFLHTLLKDYSKIVESNFSFEKSVELLLRAHSQILNNRKYSLNLLDIANDVVNLLKVCEVNEYYVSILSQIVLEDDFLYRFGFWDTAIEGIQKTISYLENNGQNDLIYYRLKIKLSTYLREQGEYDNCREIYESIENTESNEIINQVRSKLYSEWSLLEVYSRNSEAAIKFSSKGEAISLECCDYRSLVQCYMSKGRAHESDGNSQDAAKFIDKAEKLFEAGLVKDMQLEAFCKTNKGIIYASLEDMTISKLSFNKAIEISNQIHDLQSSAYACRELASVLIKEGDCKQAYKYLVESKLKYSTIEDYAALAGTLALLGDIEFSKGNIEKAEEYYKEGKNCAKELRWLSRNNLGLAQVFYHSLLHEKAIKLAQEAKDNLTQIGHKDVIIANEILTKFGEYE